jgi:hypothetical protein
MNIRAVVAVSLFLTLTVAPSVAAATINFNLQLVLDPSQIYECGGDAYPEGTQCWTNFSVDLFGVPRTTVRPDRATW